MDTREVLTLKRAVDKAFRGPDLPVRPELIDYAAMRRELDEIEAVIRAELAAVEAAPARVA